MEQTINEWASPIMALLGVIIGGLLTPIATNLIEKAKLKRTLKSELIKSVYTFFNLRKAMIQTENFAKLNIRGAEIIHLSLMRESNELNRSELERQHTQVKESALRSLDLNHHYFQKSTEIESEILYQLSLVNTFFGSKTYKVLNEVIYPCFKDSNKPQGFYDYNKLSEAEYNNVLSNLGTEIETKGVDLQNECNVIINFLHENLK